MFHFSEFHFGKWCPWVENAIISDFEEANPTGNTYRPSVAQIFIDLLFQLCKIDLVDEASWSFYSPILNSIFLLARNTYF